MGCGKRRRCSSAAARLAGYRPEPVVTAALHRNTPRCHKVAAMWAGLRPRRASEGWHGPADASAQPLIAAGDLCLKRQILIAHTNCCARRCACLCLLPEGPGRGRAQGRGEKMATVSRDVRLDNRVIDLRTPANQAIFRLQAAVGRVRPPPPPPHPGVH